jgi:transposase
VVKLFIVKLACELPAEKRAGLSTWDCEEIARQVVQDGLCPSISAETVRRILGSQQLKPWRVHHWLSPQVPRDAKFRAIVEGLCELYTRPLSDDEAVLCLDEKTNIQPRPRPAPTLAAQPGGEPVKVEATYTRAGAAQLFAAFDTRSGQVYGRCYRTKRQIEMINFLEMLDERLPAQLQRVYLVLDNSRMHHGKELARWIKDHPRFILYFTPVHCSWMNQVEQWFGVLTRKCLKICDFDSLPDLATHIQSYIRLHNETAHPYAWSRQSFEKVLSKCPPLAA